MDFLEVDMIGAIRVGADDKHASDSSQVPLGGCRSRKWEFI